MSLNTNPVAGKARLDQANPNTLADQLRALGFGSLVRRQRVALRRQNPAAQAAGAASSYDVATERVLFLPDDAKAWSISRAYARAGSAGTGEMTVAAANTTPTTGQIAVTPAGNIATLGTDAITDLDVDYEVIIGDLVEVTLPVVPGTGVCALTAFSGTAGSGTPAVVTPNVANQQGNTPALGASSAVINVKGVLAVIEAEVLAGTTLGKKIILAPAAGAPATGNARLDVAKANLQFATADAVTSARVKMIVVSGQNGGTDVNNLLENAVTNF